MNTIKVADVRQRSLLMLRGAKRRGNLYIDPNQGFAGVLAGSLQDSSPATHRLTSVRSGPLGIRHPCTQSSLLEISCFSLPFAALSFAVCCNGSFVRRSPS